MEPSEEFIRVCDLMLKQNELNDEQKKFIVMLYDNMNPYGSFLEECSEKQLKWLNWIWGKYCNGDDVSW